MKISTKLILISLIVSFVPIVTVVLMVRETSIFYQEDFQAAITLGMAIAVCIGFICPLLCMRWLFLTQLRRIRKLCTDVHSGKYSFIDLPVASDEKNAENEMVTLMREMNWMANQIHIREARLMDTAAKMEIAKTAALQSEKHYRQLIENMGDMVFTTDLKGNFTFISNDKKCIAGYEQANLLGRNIKDILLTESVAIVEENFKKQILGENVHPYEIKFVAVDERYIPAEINTSLFYDMEGNLTGIEGTVRDMTEHKRLESELFQARKMEAVGTLAGGIAHDFNNIVQGISGFTEILLLGKKENDPDYEKVTHIQTQAFRAAKLTGQLLAFSRKAESMLQPLDLNSEIEKLKEVFVRTLPRMIDIRFHLSGKLHPVNADSNQIEQIILNLIINARDAMADGGQLIVWTENVTLEAKYCQTLPRAAPGEYVLLAVSDTGMGMDKDIVEHIFEPFYTTKEVDKGTGLGLAMVYGIVKNHNGHVYCESMPGQGTTIKIYLPVVKEEKISQNADHTLEQEVIGGTETILLVDDEEAILEVGKGFLEHSGYTIITAESGEKVIEIVSKVHTFSPDLVILDLNMPGMGGYKCLQELLKIDSGINVLVTSGYSSQVDEKTLRETGARGFIAKPYQMKAMLKMVRGILDDKSDTL
ncbi:MAG: PAS domain S-box protein [Thermodesulfobacteriota bacterium]|nr:PAS domain S-box protein [Thermodesulfobacteriota bacterium]